MVRNQVSATTLLGVVIAGGILLKAGASSWILSLAGVTLLVVLFAYDEENNRTLLQSLAFAFASGFSLMLASAIVLDYLGTNAETHTVTVPPTWMPLVWAGGAFLFTIVDRVRASSGPAPGYSSSYPSAYPSAYTSAQPQQAPRPTASFTAPYAAPQPQAPPVAYAPPPVAPTPEPLPPPPPPAPYSPPPAAFSPPPAPAYAPPPPPPRPLKEATIYVGLIENGLNMLRPVRAEDLGRNYYRILEDRPENETWEFQTNQVVKCQKKNLATGKQWVAVEEAPRAS